MNRTRWWHVAVAGALLVVGALVVTTPVAPAWTTPAALAVLAAFGLFYALVGRRGLSDPRWATPLIVAVVATVAIGTALSPNVATLQCIAFPMIWALCPGESMRRPILTCVVMAIGVSAGFWISLGGGLDALVQGVVIEVVSIALGIGLGVWFTTEMRTGGENTRLLAELTAAQGQLAAMHRESGATAERERLARELHDTIAQNLTSLVMLAQRGQNRGTDGTGMHDDFELIEQVARDALTEARALVAATATVPVDGGLAAALARLVGTFERETRIEIDTSLDEVGTLPRELEVVLLRCGQEALANVRKHSGASRARLALHRSAGSITLTVGDDGIGIGAADAASAHSGFGLEGMRQRLALVGGTLRVASLAGGGTELVATVREEER
ncbi:sensor histidine kinase [Herbiconiux sp. CPCC 205763]|uniref:Sensor histidine kinase n=1 Tax=Herbiconiux aconitum TaxID=2970913 RepID=A0ABT2GNL8_9MICO|nr:sensor histidine kinase [Herbiconiux aconitum]MCS5716895.1 sensor histidine kinase [Herbiconiux aconitum]